MRENEMELFNIVYGHDDPEKAVLTAIKVFTAFLEQHEAVPMQQAVCPLESF